MNTLPALLSTMLFGLAATVQAAEPPGGAPPVRDVIERQLHQAQEQLDRSAREVAELSMRLNNELNVDAKAWTSMAQQHAMLGLSIGGSAAAAARGSHGGTGVHIVSVSPGGPADVAGLRANDVITAFNGTALHDMEGSPARQQLLTLIHDMKADEPVTIEYQRDGKTQKTQITPKSVPDFIDETYTQGLKGLSEGLSSMAASFGARGSRGFGSAEFLRVSPGLGRYFGTERGLLVVHAPKDERLKLQDGDVVLDIDGRVANGPSHAYQILSSYRSGEVMKLHVMRQQKKIELPIEVPADLARSDRDWLGGASEHDLSSDEDSD